jgi:hypothetical protein
LLLQVVEDAIAPLRKHPHKFVHPLTNPTIAREREQVDEAIQVVSTPGSGSEVKRRQYCA